MIKLLIGVAEFINNCCPKIWKMYYSRKYGAAYLQRCKDAKALTSTIAVCTRGGSGANYNINGQLIREIAKPIYHRKDTHPLIQKYSAVS
jgi:hypothetical protein